MAQEILSRDDNRITVAGGVTDDSNQEIRQLRVDPTTGRLLVSVDGGLGSETLAEVSDKSTDTAKSLYTMTEDVDVEFEDADGNTVLYLDESTGNVGVNIAPTAKFTTSLGSTGNTFDNGIRLVRGDGFIDFVNRVTDNGFLPTIIGKPVHASSTPYAFSFRGVRITGMGDTDPNFVLQSANEAQNGAITASQVAIEFRNWTTKLVTVLGNGNTTFTGNVVSSGGFFTDSSFQYGMRLVGSVLTFNRAGADTFGIGSGGPFVLNNGGLSFSSGTAAAGGQPVLTQDGTHTLALRSGVNPHNLLIYNTYTDGSNYERVRLGYTSNVITFGSEAAGTGTARNFNFTGGNVGIGETIPLAKLHINGGVGSLATGLAFGDGDSGLFEFADDQIRLQLGASNNITIFRTTDVQFGNAGSTSAGIRVTTASATVPVFVPLNDDPNTGIGWAGADILSLIAGGVNVLNATTTGIELSGNIALAEIATPANPSAGYNKLYFKSDDKLYALNSAGTEVEIGGSGGSGANTALSNLASVAINTSLISDTNNTDDLGSTGVRWRKTWTVDLESTNMPTVGGTAILTSLTAPQFTTIELGHATDTTLARVSAGVVSIEGVNIVTVSSTDTLTNKTLISPAITTPTGIVKGDVGLGNVDNTSDSTKNSATATLTNKTITNTNNNVAAKSLHSATTVVDVSAATAPTSGQVLTATSATTATWQDPGGGGGFTPKASFNTIFETAGRFATDHSGGTATFSANGVELDTTTTMNRRAAIYPNTTGSNNEFGSSPMMSATFIIGFIQGNSTATIWVGNSPTLTSKHFGFKFTTTGGTATLYATQADGTTENASSALTTGVQNDVFEVCAKMNGTASVDYYWRKNGGAWSSATNLTSNIPTDGTTGVYGYFSINNTGSSTINRITMTSFNYER